MSKPKKLKAYKVFNPDWTCKNFKYEIGKLYTIKGDLKMCENGFHACIKVNNCFSYYHFNNKNKIAEVEMSGKILGIGDEKQCSEKIKVVKELTWEEMLVLANSGYSNSGHSNSGHSNSGYSNSGYRNSGDRNSGHGNSGHGNSGHGNSGYSNSGYRNSGDRNSGHGNSGYRNSGDWNSGNWNSGFFNSKTPETIYVFNKPCNLKTWNDCSKPNFIRNITPERWIFYSNMTDKEKKENSKANICGGYLKTYTYEEAWKNAYKEASKEDKKLLKELPNFDKKIFKEITGITVR